MNTRIDMTHWHKIDTVLLDMDGTLLDLHYDNHFWLVHLPERYAVLHNINLETAKTQLLKHMQAIEGTLNWYCLDYWSTVLGVDILALKKETQHKIQERPHALAFLQFLKKQQKAVHIVTNAHPAGLELKLSHTRIADYVDSIISSHQFKAPKEDPAFWQHLCNALPFSRYRCLLIDDNSQVLCTARTFGIAHILGIHQPDSRTERQLTDVPAIYDFTEIMMANTI